MFVWHGSLDSWWCSPWEQSNKQQYREYSEHVFTIAMNSFAMGLFCMWQWKLKYTRMWQLRGQGGGLGLWATTCRKLWIIQRNKKTLGKWVHRPASAFIQLLLGIFTIWTDDVLRHLATTVWVFVPHCSDNVVDVNLDYILDTTLKLIFVPEYDIEVRSNQPMFWSIDTFHCSNIHI